MAEVNQEIDLEFIQGIYQQAIPLWINPEIEKRKKNGWIKSDFQLMAAQVLFYPEEGKMKVKLNEEAKAIAKCKVNRAIVKGEAVYDKDIDDISSIDVSDFHPNAAHITLLNLKGYWIIAFDARYNKKQVLDFIKAAKEFYDSAADNLGKGRIRAFFDNAFSCAELSAIAILLTTPDKKLLGKRHDYRHKRFENWAKLGNAKVEHSSLLNKLAECRGSARYLATDNKYKKENPQEIIKLLEEMIQFAEKNASYER